MKKFSSKIALFLFCFIILSSFEIYAHNVTKINKNQKQQKIYVSPNQLEITEKVIMVHFNNAESLIARNLSHDENGLYIDVVICEACSSHDEWCSMCKGCGVVWCPYKCRCYDTF